MITIISRSRCELMGIATLSVLMIHLVSMSGLPNRWYISVYSNWVSGLIYTPGFLFLSGFGCYFSLEKNDRVLQFYKKRMLRIFPTYILITGLFLTFLTLYNRDSFLMYLARITTISYWIEGNVAANWYISVTVLLYFFAPFFYRVIRGKFRYILWIILFVVYIMLIEALKRYVLNDMQYERLIFATYSLMFLIGMLVAKMKNMYQPHSTALLLFLPLLFPIATGVINAYSIFTFLPVIFPCFISLILSSLILFVLSDNKVQECNSRGNNKKNLGGA